MDLGFKKFFLRQRSKSKSRLISSPLTETFRQTGGYDEFAAGPPPDIGTRPIKPSEQTVKRKSFSHGKTRNVVPPEFRGVPQMESYTRPRTAPDIQQAPSDLSNHSKFGHQNRPSQNETFLPTKTSRDQPKFSTSSKGLREMRGPKHFDLLQAAVSAATAKSPPESSQGPFDFYNERIADRNVLPYKSPSLAVSVDIHTATLSNGNDDAPPADNVDSQRASFDTMRASRNSRGLDSGVADRQSGPVVLRSCASRANDNSAQPLRKSTTREDLAESHGTSGQSFVPLTTTSEVRPKKRNSVRRVHHPSGMETIQQEKWSPGISSPDMFSSLGSGNIPASRKRSRTTPMASTPMVVSPRSQNEGPAILTLKPFQDREDQINTADNNSIPWDFLTLSQNSTGHSSRHHMLDSELPSSRFGDVLSQTSNDKSMQKRQKKKRNPRHSSKSSRNGALNEVTSVDGEVRKQSAARDGRDLAVDDYGRSSNEGNDTDDVEIEEAVTHQTDPVQILRASVVSANGYIRKVGDNLILGKVLHHRPSRGLSDIDEATGHPLTNNDNVRSQSEDANPAPRSTTTPSHTLTTLSESSRPSRSLSAGSASLQVPPREPPEAKTSLPISDNPQTHDQPGQHSQSAEGETMSIYVSNSDTAEASSPSQAIISTKNHIAAPQQPPNISESDEPGGSTPPLPEVLTRDFALPSETSRNYRSEAASEMQPRVDNVSDLQPSREIRENSSSPQFIPIRQNEAESKESELDRSIALKKEAAAKALLRLKEVMTVPTWGESSVIGRPRASTNVPSHWRGLSIEDGGPIAPSAIFQKVMIPALTPSIARHSGLSSNAERDTAPELEPTVHGTVEYALPPSLRAALNQASFREAADDDIVASATSLESSETAWPDRTVTNGATPVPQERGVHSRMNSTVSAASGTSAYSLPHHMVPTRGSSLRDSGSVSGEYGGSLDYHAEKLGWH